MELHKQQAWWDSAAADNAKFAILSTQEHWTEEAFFESGVEWWAQERMFARENGVVLEGATALDFGCGIGRMSRALAKNYESVTGIDISPNMIEQAPPFPGVTFRLVPSPSLPFEDSCFDLVHASIVVQHIAMPYSLDYVREFFRVAKQAVLFDVPIGERGANIADGMYCMSSADILSSAADARLYLRGLTHFIHEPYLHSRFLFLKAPQ